MKDERFSLKEEYGHIAKNFGICGLEVRILIDKLETHDDTMELLQDECNVFMNHGKIILIHVRCAVKAEKGQMSCLMNC